MKMLRGFGFCVSLLGLVRRPHRFQKSSTDRSETDSKGKSRWSRWRSGM